MPTNSNDPVPLKNAKGGRPRKSTEETRSVRLSAYVTPSEAEEIKLKLSLGEEAGAHHMSVSDFLRKLALNKELSPTVRPSVVKKLRSDIGRAMGNINQIARRVNQGKVEKLAETDLEEIYEFLGDRLDKLDQL